MLITHFIFFEAKHGFLHPNTINDWSYMLFQALHFCYFGFLASLILKLISGHFIYATYALKKIRVLHEIARGKAKYEKLLYYVSLNFTELTLVTFFIVVIP